MRQQRQARRVWKVGRLARTGVAVTSPPAAAAGGGGSSSSGSSNSSSIEATRMPDLVLLGHC